MTSASQKRIDRAYYLLDAARDDLRIVLMELNRDRSAQTLSPETGTQEAAETAHRLQAVIQARRDIADAMQIVAQIGGNSSGRT